MSLFDQDDDDDDHKQLFQHASLTAWRVEITVYDRLVINHSRPDDALTPTNSINAFSPNEFTWLVYRYKLNS